MGLIYKEGDKVIATAEVTNNLNETFQAGTEFIVCRVDNTNHDMAMHPVSEYKPGDSGIWFWPKDCETKFKLFEKVVVPRVNYLYVVEDEDGVYLKTFDRDHAREEKASWGGKKAGVVITAYAAVKEIR